MIGFMSLAIPGYYLLAGRNHFIDFSAITSSSVIGALPIRMFFHDASMNGYALPAHVDRKRTGRVFWDFRI